jgi:hypothetical protein
MFSIVRIGNNTGVAVLDAFADQPAAFAEQAALSGKRNGRN